MWIINFFSHLPISSVFLGLVRFRHLSIDGSSVSVCEKGTAAVLWHSSIVLLPLVIYSTQLILELSMSCCSFKLDLQRSIIKAVVVLTMGVIVIDCASLAR